MDSNAPIHDRRLWAIAVLPALITFLAYLPLLHNQFVNWDDPDTIQNNLHIRSFSLPNLQWMMTNYELGNWIPLTWLSLALNYQIGKLDPVYYHLGNLLFHGLNTALVFLLSYRILGLAAEKEGPGSGKSFWAASAAFLTALLFGLHPLHVESVAWASERKDVLCGCFYLLGLLAYLKYACQPAPKAGQLLLSLGWFILALLSKPMAVTLPFIFLLLDLWPLGRFRQKRSGIFLEKTPFLVPAFLLGSVNLWSQYHFGAMMNQAQLPLSFRAMNAFHSIIFYLQKMIYPAGLAALCPIDLGKTFSPFYIYSALLVASISLICFLYHKKRPYLGVAWSCYLIALAPVLGILQGGSQAAADRYTYLPSIGLFLLFAAALATFLYRWKTVWATVVLGIAAVLGYGTYQQTLVWKDPISLWENVVRVYPRSTGVAYASLADAYERTGRLDEALTYFDLAEKTNPGLAFPWTGKGKTLLDKGLFQESIPEFMESMRLNPGFALPHRYLAMAYERMDRTSDAIKEIQEAIRLDPEGAEDYYEMGLLWMDQKQGGKASDAFQRALSIEPDNATYRMELHAVTP